MKKSLPIWLSCLAVVTFGLTACNNNDDIVADNKYDEGFFTATFFPQPSTATRAAVNGQSNQIQSLKCLIYKKQDDDTYKYVNNQDVISYTGNVGNIDAQLYTWPLTQSVSFELPSGDYKAVFVGNTDKKLFSDQNEEILTSYENNYSSARINLPTNGAPAYNDYNMPYLCTVDFSPSNPSPSVLLQRVASKNVYGRNFIDTNNAVSMLVNNIVKQVREENLTTDIVKGLLHSKILDALSSATGLDAIAEGLTTVVDKLVNLLLGEVLEALNDYLLQEITSRLESALKGEGNTGLLGLGYILNPWTTAEAVDVTYSSFPKSIDFDRNCQSYLSETTWENISVVKDDNNIGTFSVVSLCGDENIKEININKNSTGYTKLLAPILNTLDDKVLNGLLVNIHVPLSYTQQSNLQYSTTYELLNITLSDFSTESSGESLQLNINLKDIVNLKETVSQLLGDNILSQIVGGLSDKLLEPLLNALNTVVIEKLDIKLPGLNISNIVIEGGWDATYVSDGTIAPTDKE